MKKIKEFTIFFQIKPLANFSTRSFDIPLRLKSKRRSFMSKRAASLKESYFESDRNYESTCVEHKVKNRDNSKIYSSLEGEGEDYDFQLFDIEDQADMQNSW